MPVVHCKKAPFDVYIGRPSQWGNPFVIGYDGNRAEVIEKYRAWVQTQPELMAKLKELKGKPAACHGDVLEQLASSLS